MHIKQITIQGFKSYKDQTFIQEPFHKHHNVIVGRNGSGKSNFFNAILFVLSDKYSKLKAEERQSLLHEGTGRGVMVAYVEIIFDNSDNRLPIEKDEVSIRRTIGLKKDEYRINNKTASQREVLNLLESAGFSSSNPYYVVEQGKVARLTTMRDEQRLELLKEVAGTRVYDERRKESIKIMRTTNAKKKKITDVISFIKDRIKELKKEVEKLKKYQKYDKQRRCIEYSIYNKEFHEAREKLEELEELRQNFNENTDVLYRERLNFQMKVKNFEKELTEFKLDITVKRKEEQLFQKEKKQILEKITKIDLQIRDKKEENQMQEEKRLKLQNDLSEVEKSVKKLETQLKNDLIPKLESLIEQENQIKRDLANSEIRSKELFIKQGGRNTQFSSKLQRDEWIKNQIKSTQKSIVEESQIVKENSDEISNNQNEISEIKVAIKERTKSSKENKRNFNKLNKNLKDLQERRNDLTTLRKEKWKEQNENEKELQKFEDELEAKERELESTFSREINRGIKSVKRIVQERKLKGVYGTIIENFKCKPQFRRAIEVTGGNSLFHIIVENDKISSDIIEIMNEGNYPGRVTFMPLNRLGYLRKPRDIQDASKSVPLMKLLTYKNKFENSFLQVFGKSYLCKNIGIASKFSKDYNVDCVTLDGDKVSKRGAITGGYVDSSKSRIDIQDSIREIRKKVKDETETLAKCKEIIEVDLNGELATVTTEINKIAPKVRNLQNLMSQQESDMRGLKDKLSKTEEKIAELKRRKANSLVGVEKNKQILSSFQEELRSSFDSKNLSRAEQRELNDLTKKIHNVQTVQLPEIINKKMKYDRMVNDLRNKLDTNLLIRLEELKHQEEVMKIDDSKEQGEDVDLLINLNNTKEEENVTQQKLEDIITLIEKIDEKIKEKTQEIDKLKGKEGNKLRQIEKDGNKLEKLLNRKKIFQQKEKSAINKIRDLGSIPENVEDYEDKSVQNLVKDLHKTKEKLKEYTHVNKKAFDQYEQLSKQKKDFISKKDELDKGASAISKLIKTLDRKKNECISRTFKQVSANFKDIFQLLVPEGNGKLLMIERDQTAESESEGDEDDEKMVDEDQQLTELEKEGKKIEIYTGVMIRVQFASQLEAQIMQQLSGGQKTLVALTLMSAIQKCDPAPFYLYDEIDSALDSQYRKRIAQMINKQSKEDGIQFITTTFKNELVDVADRCYKIDYSNKVSRIIPVSKEVAKGVLHEQEERKKV